MVQTASEFAALLANTPDLRAVPLAQIRIVTAMRVAVMAHGKHGDVVSCLARHLGGTEPGYQFASVIKVMGDCWPDPIMIQSLRSNKTTYDEMMLLDLVTAVVQDQPAHFHGFLCEMIAQRECEKLHDAISGFVRLFKKGPAN